MCGILVIMEEWRDVEMLSSKPKMSVIYCRKKSICTNFGRWCFILKVDLVFLLASNGSQNSIMAGLRPYSYQILTSRYISFRVFREQPFIPPHFLKISTVRWIFFSSKIAMLIVNGKFSQL